MNKKLRLRRYLAMILSALAMFMTVFLSFGSVLHVSAAQVVRGDNIPYKKYLPGATYSTHLYTADGRAAYCIESEKAAVPTGDYASSGALDYNTAPMLVLALHYGYGGSGSWQMKTFFSERYGIDLSDEQQYLYTHIVANYAYVGADMSSTPGQFYKGLSAEIAEASGINEWIRFLGRVLGGSADYTGKSVAGGYITTFDTGTQRIAVMGEITYRENTPTPPPEPEKPKENIGRITVTKNGETLSSYTDKTFVWEEKGLVNAEFELSAGEDIFCEEQLIHEKGAVIKAAFTSEDGTASFEELYPGSYIITEITAPEGFVKNDSPISVVLSKDGDDVSEMVHSVSVYDQRKKAEIAILKTDTESGETLSGAEFGLYAGNEIRSADGEVLVNAGELLMKDTTDADGTIRFAMDLPLGEYYVKELTAPFGYVVSSEEFPVHFDGSSEKEITDFKHTFSNRPVTGEITVQKIGESLAGYEDGKFIYEARSLEGAEFDLYRVGEEEPILHLVTDEDGTVTAGGLALGDYLLVETAAPYGMKLDETPTEIKVEHINQTTEVVHISREIINEREKVTFHITKKAKDSGEKLTGGRFAVFTGEDLYNYKGEMIVPADTMLEESSAVDGEVEFVLDYPHGSYYLMELEGIPGYYRDNERHDLDAAYGSIDDTGIEYTVFNTKIPPAPVTPENPSETKVLGASKNNYVTEDGGESGYSFRIDTSVKAFEEKAGSGRNEQEETAGVSYPEGLIYGGMLLALAAGFIIAGRKKRIKGGANEKKNGK
mgnify:CR=1 FL=1